MDTFYFRNLNFENNETYKININKKDVKDITTKIIYIINILFWDLNDTIIMLNNLNINEIIFYEKGLLYINTLYINYYRIDIDHLYKNKNNEVKYFVSNFWSYKS